MPKIDLGQVRGEDGKIVQVNPSYVNDGGEPSVETELVGDPTAMTLNIVFKNLVRSEMTESELDQIVNDMVVKSSNVMTATRTTKLWEWIKKKFAATIHKHDAADIDSGTLSADRIGVNTISSDKLDSALRDSIYHIQENYWHIKPESYNTFAGAGYNMPSGSKSGRVVSILRTVTGFDDYHVLIAPDSIWVGVAPQGTTDVSWSQV